MFLVRLHFKTCARIEILLKTISYVDCDCCEALMAYDFWTLWRCNRMNFKQLLVVCSKLEQTHAGVAGEMVCKKRC